MSDPADLLDEVGAIARQLGSLGLLPVLIGGMALVILGSRRVTRDFDFVVARPGPRLKSVVAALYDQGLQLAARMNEAGDITATIDNRRLAAARLRIDTLTSAFFQNPRSGLRVDLLFDFPLAAIELAARATPIRIRSHLFHVASTNDLLNLKRIATPARSAPGDAEDLAYLQRLLRNQWLGGHSAARGGARPEAQVAAMVSFLETEFAPPPSLMRASTRAASMGEMRFEEPP